MEEELVWGTPSLEKGFAGDWFGAIGGPPKRAAEAPAPSGGGGTYYGGGYTAPAPRPYWEDPAWQARRAAETEINAAYTKYIDQDLTDLLRQSQGLEQTTMDQLTGRRDTEAGTLQSKLDRSLAGLAESEIKAEEGRKSSLRDVGRDYARKLQSGYQMLSQRGATDSSAGQIMMPLALTQEQAGARANVQGQANQQIADIGLQRKGAQGDFEDQTRLLEDWFSNESLNVRNKYADFRTQIEREKAGANLEKAQALANINRALAGGLAGKLANFQTSFVNMSNELKQALQQSKPNLNPTAITQSYQVNPLQRPAIPGMTFGDVPPSQPLDSLTPTAPKKRGDDAGSLAFA